MRVIPKATMLETTHRLCKSSHF
uniref:Uncharacterized protein n=1 Tax=Arundo donax TaxID=35708 RepID=A0A0A9AM14_ARUDO